jgi:hypothetical protein
MNCLDPSLRSHRLVPPRSPGGRVGARPAGEVCDRAARRAVVLEGAKESPWDESPPTYEVRKISVNSVWVLVQNRIFWKLGRSKGLTTYLSYLDIFHLLVHHHSEQCENFSQCEKFIVLLVNFRPCFLFPRHSHKFQLCLVGCH